ncbi:MAG: hypothetical protein NTZ35_10220 [Ignavibacteriales bacterium]|nr:hypothetical protein [Ignavibacteriales bacterium]
MTVWAKLCERILLERPFRNDITAADATHDLLFSGMSEQLEFGTFEHHVLASLCGISIAQLHGKLTHGANEFLPFSK